MRMTTFLVPGVAHRARRGSPMTAGTRRIAQGLASICRVPPICDPHRIAAAGAVP